MSNKILSTLNIGNNSYEIDDAFARQKIEEVDNNLSKINPVYSTSGSVVSFDDGADNLPLDELIVDINPVQDLHGYDHPWIGGSGKNLANPNTIQKGGYYNGVGTWSANNLSATTDLIPVLPNTNYVSSLFDKTGIRLNACVATLWDNENTCTGQITTQTFITGENTKFVRIRNFDAQGDYITSDNFIFQIEQGTAPTNYEPYENICPITGWTGMNVQRCGKNLWNKQLINGSVLIDGLVVGGKYTVTAKMIDPNTSTNFYIQRVLKGSSQKTTVGYVIYGTTLYTPKFTVESEYDYYVCSDDTYTNVTDVQIEKDAIATEYESYNGTEIPISWESEAGTVYGGNLNVLTGVLTVTQYGFDGGTVDWVKTESYAYGKFSINTSPLAAYSVSTPTIISSAYKSAANSSASANGNYVWIRSSSANIRQLRVKDDTKDNMTAEEFKVAMSGVQFVYELVNPIIYQLTPHEVKSLLGQNNIFTNINSKNILVSYKADVQKCIDNKLNVAETAYRTTSIPYGQVDATSTSTNFTATIDGITELRDGVCVILKNGVVTSASGFTININNLGAKPVYSSMAASTRETTVFNSAYTIMLIYSTSLNNGDGGWWFYRGYNSDTNTTGYVLRTNSMSLPVSSHTHHYRLLFTSADGTHFVPANNDTTDNTTAIKNVCQEKIDPFGTIRYYNGSSNLEAEGVPSGTTMWEQNTFSLGYSFNHVGGAINLAIRKPVYIKALPQSDGSAIIDANVPYVQDLPTTEDGYIYIYLGVTYSASNMELTSYHPVYYYHNGAIRPWLGFTGSEPLQDVVSSVNGKTGTVTLTAEDVGAMQGMTILSYGHSTWAEFLEAYEANRVVYCKASANSDPSTGQQGRMAFFAYVQYKRQGYSDRAEFQYYRSTPTHTNTQQGDQVFCYSLTPAGGGTWSVEVRQASSRVVAGTGLSSAYTTDKVTLSLDADYKNKIDTLWTDYQSALIALDGGE